jgi:hypothetical protein
MSRFRKEFFEGFIYSAQDRTNNLYCYRCVRSNKEEVEFVDLMSWKHHTMPAAEWKMVNYGTELEHEIKACNCVAKPL